MVCLFFMTHDSLFKVFILVYFWNSSVPVHKCWKIDRYIKFWNAGLMGIKANYYGLFFELTMVQINYNDYGCGEKPPERYEGGWKPWTQASNLSQLARSLQSCRTLFTPGKSA